MAIGEIDVWLLRANNLTNALQLSLAAKNRLVAEFGLEICYVGGQGAPKSCKYFAHGLLGAKKPFTLIFARDFSNPIGLKHELDRWLVALHAAAVTDSGKDVLHRAGRDEQPVQLDAPMFMNEISPGARVIERTCL